MDISFGILDCGFCTQFGFCIKLLLLHADSGRRRLGSGDKKPLYGALVSNQSKKMALAGIGNSWHFVWDRIADGSGHICTLFCLRTS